MNGLNKTPFKKRSDPFAAEEKQEETKIIATEIKKSPFDSSKSSKLLADDEPKEAVREEVVVTKPIQKQQVKRAKVEVREKYTATMDKSLRIRIKKAAIDLDVDFSTFIEQACAEKLEREGK